MAHLFSPAVSPSTDLPGKSNQRVLMEQNRFHTWRKLWLNLAIAEKELGLPISVEAIDQMKDNLVRFTRFGRGICSYGQVAFDAGTV
jgi:hypothetical protein